MATGLESFAKKLAEADLGEFEPRPYYEEKTDSLVLYFKDLQSYSKRITKYFTVFLSMADDSLVGVEVKGIIPILKAIENLGVVDLTDPVAVNVDGDMVDLRVVVRCALVPEPEEPVSGKDFEELQTLTRGIQFRRPPLACTE